MLVQIKHKLVVWSALKIKCKSLIQVMEVGSQPQVLSDRWVYSALAHAQSLWLI